MIYFLFVILILLSAFLVMIVLLQRGRGGGLAGAFGSGGGTTSAFGTKTGDVFTWVTVVSFVLFMILSIVLFTQVKWASAPDKFPVRVSEDADRMDAETTNTTAKLRWRDDSSNALGYKIALAQSKNGPFDTKIIDSPNSQYELVNNVKQFYCVIDGLTPGTDYYARVGNWNKGSANHFDPQSNMVFHFKTTGEKPAPATTQAATQDTIGAPATRRALPETTSSAPAPTQPAATTPASRP